MRVEIDIARRVEAPADTVWALVGAFGSDTLTRGYVEKVEVEGEGLGAVRTYHTVERLGGAAVRQRLDILDPVDRVIGYRMVDNGSVPWTDYAGVIRVTPCGPGACAVSMHLHYIPFGADEQTCRGLSHQNVDAYFANLNRALGLDA